MLKFIVIGAALFIVYKLFMGDKRKREMEQEKHTEQKVASGELIRDPVCGTYVQKDGDIRVREGETVHVFCSYDCRDKFLKQLEAEDVTPKE
ncbi:transcriptional regulator [Salidesulfovibrio onnuriiensis]|uniref:transcriptional regulator n=1 Tax=Salidesulfovibrio onnuriiensis TaxID=2583823 RepID=UPI0011CA0D93|nr:transcriptional regulator [Salidesulfovibrio onnuriiensis]